MRHAALEQRIAAALPIMERMLALAEGFAADLRCLGGPPPEPRFEQDWFPRLDAAMLYALVRGGPPLQRVLEIGSGHSTRFMARAALDAGATVAITCLDPAPRASLKGLPIRHLARLVQEAEPDLLTELAAGDILFIDSSHVAMPGSDVDLLLNGVLPALTPGVLIHLHDIFLPDPYPEAWAWRGYNEQVAVGCLLQGGAFEILFASHFMATRAADRLARSPLAGLPLLPGAFESSLWLRKLA